MSLFTKRSASIYVSKALDNFDISNTYQFKVIDFSYNQTSQVDFVEYKTMDSAGDRYSKPVVSEISPVDFTFTTYFDIRKILNKVFSPQEFLWMSLIGQELAINNLANISLYSFGGSTINKAVLMPLTVWFYYGTSNKAYRLDNCIIESATVNLSIDQLTTITWTGTALSLTGTEELPDAYDYSASNYCLYNKLTKLTVIHDADAIDLPLVDGNFTYQNSINYLKRKELGKTIRTEGHYTGSVQLGGEITSYLRAGAGKSVYLYDKLFNNIDDVEEFESFIQLNIGGTVGKRAQINLSPASIVVPTVNVDDVLTATFPYYSSNNTTSNQMLLYPEV